MHPWLLSEMNNTKLDNAKDLDVAMPIYNLIEYSDNYLKKLTQFLGISWNATNQLRNKSQFNMVINLRYY